MTSLSSEYAQVRVPFFRSDLGSLSMAAVESALRSEHLAGNGPHTAECHRLLRSMSSNSFPLLTHSGTAALEMAALLLSLHEGDEVIMPSWTFPSTANAVVLRGAIPVFVDARSDTLNIDEALVEASVTARTRAIFCVHYAGVACEMDALTRICERYGLALVEDAAQGVGATWRGAALGGIGDFGALSFHGSKNVTSGEGGALLINRPEYLSRAEMVWEKGTDRARFVRGEIAWYEWRTVGSSYLPSELTAALLASELRRCGEITRFRLVAWNRYDAAFRAAGLHKRLDLPNIPEAAGHNGHIYHLRTPTIECRARIQRHLAACGIEALTHYVPLHSSPAGRRFGRAPTELPVTEKAAATLLRLPLYARISTEEQSLVVRAVISGLGD